MRVAINCRSFLNKKYTGIGRYAHNLVNTLSQIDPQNEYLLYVQKKLFDTKRKTPVFTQKNFSVKIDRFNRGLQETLGAIDIYHSPSPDSLPIEKAKIVVTVHDLIYKAFPQSHTQSTIEITDRHIHEAVLKASKIICCSQSTMDDLERYFSVDKSKICMVHQGVDKNIFYPLDSEQRQKAKKVIEEKGISDPFIFFVGTIEPRKNLNNLIRAFFFLKEKKQFNGKLVIAGMSGWMNESIYYFVDHLKLKNDVVFLGYLTDEELRYLYNLAEVFVFPSLYEGFGFPIVEAFSCGAAVITSNVSSCPEIAGGAALTVDPMDPRAIADAMAQTIGDQRLKENLQQKARVRAKDFSFLKTAEETLKVYGEVYHSKG
ncbi:MAG: glycosyltransferase family 1 protein [Candidatus Omnitrophota bacterium]